ncbi:helix-turn-helix transcriptional regulator [Streptomyces sp. CB01881]|uniref:AraC family transcriptional regulator n=1 Tax=Streptomyces sp. CB01881 TaxID=2078691 RepID=UPI000CDC98D2|nr:helix-turn-helix transcriptional regulator [Streptomyces sp. CB01881]AUY52919.1 AraC family transcriptional regulator [Streptomyces sp. CB01881]TYC70636.1 AraC family transcriptional regulator [Streptomyces sp. CB01881]
MHGKSEDRDDYQLVPRPVAAMARDLPDGHHIPPHHHQRAQLIYGTSGAVTVITERGTWVVPATRAVWVPAGVTHAMTCTGAVRMRTLYVEPAAAPSLLAGPLVVSVSPLLRELIEEATRLPVAYATDGRDGRLMDLLLLELEPDPVAALHLPAPTDPTLVGLCAAIREDPGARWTAGSAANRAHLSVRSLHRRFSAATGMTLAHWVRQARLIHALTLLAHDTPVTSIAAQLGYATPSAFTAMFRRAVGQAPSAFHRGPDEPGRRVQD